MEIVNKVAMAGGLFACYAFIHFFVDWIFQSHSEAMVKHNNPKVRAKHCLIYTIGFMPLFFILDFQLWQWLVGINILFWSHFIEDTYMPVFLWAKYIRKPPEMTELVKKVELDGYVSLSIPDDKVGFQNFINTTLGKILMIAIDQLIHLTFLIPLVFMSLK